MKLKKPLEDIERSLQKTYRKTIWAKFIKAIKTYELIEEGDKIAVAVSGGKDSLLLAKLFQQLHRFSEISFEVVYISMDPGFNKENLENLELNCELLNIPIKIRKSDVFYVSNKLSSENPCYMCARMRRGFLYNFAKEEGCNKLALGHHFDDVVETTLLNIFYGSQFKTMVPKIEAENFPNMELIRPLVLIKESDIIRFTNNAGLKTMSCGCEVTKLELGSKRKEMKNLLKEMEKNNPNVSLSIFNSATNVNLNQIYGYEIDDKKISFNEIYKRREKK
ncbi:MAG: tRNA lysidine(34) synthetase [Acholeplasmatales bacterium]